MSGDALREALSKLSEAHGQQALMRAFSGVQRQVRLKRAKEGIGNFANAIMEAIGLRDRMKGAGMPPAEVSRAFEGVIRDVWPKPKGRELAWRYACQSCGDTGAITYTCKAGARCAGTSSRKDGPNEPAGRYLRLCARDPDSTYEHEYIQACACARGDRFRPKRVTELDALERAAQPVKKPTRFGR